MKYFDIEQVTAVWFVGKHHRYRMTVAEVFKRYGKQLYIQTNEVLTSDDARFFSRISTSSGELRPCTAKTVVVVSAQNELTDEVIEKARVSTEYIVTIAQVIETLRHQKNSVVTIGTHGKTTTAVLLGYCLQQADYDPLVLTDTTVGQFAGRALVGGSAYMVAELDASRELFETIQPTAALVTTIGYGNPDEYTSVREYTQAFISFLRALPEYGFVVANVDDNRVQDVITQVSNKIITYGTVPSAEWRIESTGTTDAGQSFRLYHLQNLWGDGVTQLPYSHDLVYIAGVVAAAVTLGVPQDSILRAIKSCTFGMLLYTMRYSDLYTREVAVVNSQHPHILENSIAYMREQDMTQPIVLVYEITTASEIQYIADVFARLSSHVLQSVVIASGCEQEAAVYLQQGHENCIVVSSRADLEEYIADWPPIAMIISNTF